MRRFWRISRLFLLAYLGLLLLLVIFEKSLVFLPTKFPGGNWTVRHPVAEEADFTAADGTRLHGWYAEHPAPRAVVLYAHGNAGNISHRYDVLRTLFDELKVSVLMFDYRGYGKSEGDPSEDGVLADARAARAWLAKRAGVAEQDIILYGGSLGTGVMVDLAAADGARGLVLHSAYTSLPDVASCVYPWMPCRWVMRTQLDSLSKIAEYPGPLLQFHGEADDLIPFDMGRRLFDAAPGLDKTWIPIPRGTHDDAPAPSFYRHFSEFLSRLK